MLGVAGQRPEEKYVVVVVELSDLILELRREVHEAEDLRHPHVELHAAARGRLAAARGRLPLPAVSLSSTFF